MSILAINGGTPYRSKPFSEYNPFGQDDKDAVCRVIDRGMLSGFVGSHCDEFFGGPEVRGLEEEWASACGMAFAVTANSATSSLEAALAACGVGPGDEVIVSPFTMSATIAAILFNHAVPVFVDVTTDTFNIDPEKIEIAITPRTRVIMVVHLFGHPADMPRIMEIAQRHDILVVEDNAQSLGATIDGKPAGTFGDIGVFSLNRHKLIQSGEGGIAVTENLDLATRMQLVRNHGENAAKGFGLNNLANTLGHNFRMTELEAAVARVQFSKRRELISQITKMSDYLDAKLRGLDGLTSVAVLKGYTHTRMHHTMLYDATATEVPLDKLVAAINAEGIPVWGGYISPQYLLPLFQKQVVFGETGCPLKCPHYAGELQNYAPGLCPTAEHLNTVMINHDLHRPPNTLEDMKDIVGAVHKVYEHLDELQTSL